MRFKSLCLTLALFLSWDLPFLLADLENDDHYFQEVTTQAWREQSRREKSRLEFGFASIVDDKEIGEQIERAARYEAAGNPKKAVKAYQKALKLNPPYPVSAEILWRLGQDYESLYRWQEAFETYRRLAREFPGYEQSEAALDRQLEAAKALASKNKKAVMKEPTNQSREEMAVQLLEALENQVSRTAMGGACLHEAGVIYKNARRHHEASAAFYQVVLNYPGHPLFKEALYESGLCASLEVRASDYDEHQIQTALERLERFARENPEDPRAKQAKEICGRMQALLAQKLFEIGEFYDRLGSREAACIYYQQVLEKFPESAWAKRAKEHLGS